MRRRAARSNRRKVFILCPVKGRVVLGFDRRKKNLGVEGVIARGGDGVVAECT